MLNNTCVITFSGSPVHRDYQKEFHRLYGHLFGKHIEYTYDWLKTTDFFYNNSQVFKYDKYAGYFLWKPYIINKTLRENPDMEVLYCDSNLRFTNWSSFENVYLTLMDLQGAFFVKHDNFVNRDWTKRDTFIMMRCDEEKYWNAHQVWTPLMGFSHTKNIQTLLNDYMTACRVPEVVTEIPNVYGENLPGFREHRWEQSVMSILVEKYGYNGIPDSQMMKWITKEYSPELIKMKEEINANPLSEHFQPLRPDIPDKSR